MMREIENSLFVGGGYVINDKFIVNDKDMLEKVRKFS